MRIEYGDLWDYWTRGYYVGITTNTVIRNGKLVMGAGVAKQARDKFPGLDREWALDPSEVEEVVLNYEHRLVRIPTKRDWKNPSSLDLIEKSIHGLRWWFGTGYEMLESEQLAIPPLGCGLGGLDWEGEVRPLLEKAGLPDRVVVVLRR